MLSFHGIVSDRKEKAKISITPNEDSEEFTLDSSDNGPWRNLTQRNSLIVTHGMKKTFSWCNINAFGEQPSPEIEKSPLTSLLTNKKSTVPKHILKNVSGAAYPGEFLVMMGASGAGKTTLLNCLTFRNLSTLTVSGLVCINNEPITQTQLAAQSGYIQQDDLFINYLSVREHLIFQSKLRLSISHEEALERVEEVIRELALKKYEFSQIGDPGTANSISVAERKKLALASELLTNPPLLFCDEPTTGLDSFSSLSVIRTLRDISRTGRTVVTTVHQPSSELFHLFDKLLLMAEGRTAFLGTITEASHFFTKLQAPCPKNFNPADHYIQLLAIAPGREETCRRTVNSICNAFQATTLGVKMKLSAENTLKSVKNQEGLWTSRHGRISPYKVGWWSQMKALFWRAWLSIIKNPEVLTRRCFMALVEVLFITLIYFHQTLNQYSIKNIDGILFLIIVNITFQNIFGVVNSFCGEFPIFMKEHKDGMYRTDVYFLSKMFCDIPFSLFMAFLSLTVCYFVTGLNPELNVYFTALIVCFLTCLAGQGAGYFISIVAPNSMMALPLVDILISPLFLLGGIFINIRSIPSYLYWLSDLSMFRYSYDALLINQWTDVSYIPCDTNSTSSTVCINNGIAVLKSLAIDVSDFWLDIRGLILLILLFRILAFCVLLYKSYGKD